ncbi:MAG TPA: DUF2381 family protein [Myxococcaceae bacterium]|jgi:hypothetical protein
MRDVLPSWCVLPLVLVASVAMAKRPDVVERIINLSEHPAATANKIYVASRVVTVLRFQKEVEPAQTRMLGWEGWFEPLLLGGKKVVLEPLRDIEPGDRFMLLVTLEDGTEIPFVVTSEEQPLDGRRVADQQVTVIHHLESASAVQASLYESLKRERDLREKIERYEQEDSVDHALAALLAKDATKQTPFREWRKWRREEGDVEFVVRLFKGKGKAAVLFTITNREDQPWKMKMARLYTVSGWKDKPFAVCTDHEVITSGTTGFVAVVVDKSAFEEGTELKNLLLEVYRDDGYRQLFVLLDPSLVSQ